MKKHPMLQHSTWYHLICTNTVHAPHHGCELLCCVLRHPHSYFTHLAECRTRSFVSEPKRSRWELNWEERVGKHRDAQLRTEYNSSQESQFFHVSVLCTVLTEVAHCIRMFLKHSVKRKKYGSWAAKKYCKKQTENNSSSHNITVVFHD